MNIIVVNIFVIEYLREFNGRSDGDKLGPN